MRCPMDHKYASDCHNHSSCSPDGNDLPQAMLDRARELGLYAYTLTDHCECNDYDGQYRARSEAAWAEMEKLNIPEGLIFLRGIELGQMTQNPEGAREAYEKYPYDLAIGSLHNLRGRKDFYYMDAGNMSHEELHRVLEEYWAELLEMIDLGGFDTLGHLTYPLRYIQGERGVYVDLSEHRDGIDRVLRALIGKGKALEVNTSGLFGKLGETMPGRDILRRYHELGGRLLTFGSDAHNTGDLGGGIDKAMEQAREIGFKEFTIYRRHEPVMLPLE